MRSGLITVLTSVAFLAGCVAPGGGAQISSRGEMEGIEPIKRLLIYYNAKSPHFTGTLYTAFVTSTQRRLESCGMTVTTLEFDPVDVDMKKKIAQTIMRAEPNAIVTVVRDGGNLVTGSGGTSGDLYFNAEAFDKQRSKNLWKARISYHMFTKNIFVDDKQSGERFAAQLVSRMAGDKLVTGCPPDVVTPK